MNRDKINEALRHVHYTQGYVQSVRSSDEVVKASILARLDHVEVDLIRLRAAVNES